nr:hypothetical protein [Woeseiaceae bacterium]
NVGGLPVYQLTVNTSSNIVVAELGINGGQQIDSVDTLLLEINGGANSTTLVWTGTWYEVNDPAFVSAVVAAVDTPLDFSVTPVSPPSTPSYFNFDVPLDIIDAVGVNAFSYDAGATQPGDTLLVFVTSAVGAGPLSGVTYAGSDMTLRFTPTGWPNVNAPQTWIYTLDNPPANSNQMVVTYVTSPSAVTDLRVFAMVLRNGQLGNIEQAAYFGDTGTNDLPITIQSADSAVLLVYSNERSNENLGIGPGSDPLRIVDDRQANGFASLFCDNLSPGAGVFTAQLTTTATGRRRHALLVEVLPSQ